LTHDAAITTNLAGRLTGADLRTLTRNWQHPLTHNLALRDVAALFAIIGSAETQHNGELRLRAGDEVLTLVRPHGKDLTADEVVKVRHFLDRTGWSPTASARAPTTEPAADLVIVVYHAGVKVHRLGFADEPHHLLHDVDRKHHDSDREETFPADQRFFADVAGALAPAGRIVVISHGKGQSNEAHHLIEWLDAHRPAIHARVFREISADLPYMTTGELLSLAHHALATPTDQATPKGTPE